MTQRSFQARLAFALTQRCNLHCRHCLADVGPATASGTSQMDLPPQGLQEWIDQVAGSLVRSISFTGGEPFLVYDTLVAGVSQATRHGLTTTALTNAYWASSLERARAHLLPLRALGVLKISTDEFHQEFVPLSHVQHAIQAAQELGIRVQIKFCYVKDEDTELRALEERLGGRVSRDQINVTPVYRLGRAGREIGAEQFARCDLHQPCAVANVPLVHPDGAVYACCGATFEGESPLLLGNLQHQSWPEVLDASETNVILHILRLHGPGRLWDMLHGEYGASLAELELDTTSSCSLCVGLMTNPFTQAWLARQAQSPTLIRQIAIERFLLLQEATMLARLADNAPCQESWALSVPSHRVTTSITERR